MYSPLIWPKKGWIRKLFVFLIFFSGTFFLKNLVWTQFWRPGTWTFGFLVENYIYSLIPRSKLVSSGQNTAKLMLYAFSVNVGFYKTGFWLFPGVLEGLGSSGRLIGTISTYPGTYRCLWSRVKPKKRRGNCLPSTVAYQNDFMMPCCGQTRRSIRLKVQRLFQCE